MHKTKNLDDTYLGSGKLIKQAIRKYGKSNFVKEILHVYATEVEMIESEKSIVTNEFRNNPNTYNIAIGGKYGSPESNGLSFKGRLHSISSKQKMSDSFKWRKIIPKTPEHKLKISNTLKNKYKDPSYNSHNLGIKRPQQICPHCNKIGGGPSMPRFHFNNCKVAKKSALPLS